MVLSGQHWWSIVVLGSLAPAYPCRTSAHTVHEAFHHLALMTLLGTGNLIKSVDGVLSLGHIGPLFPSQGSLWGHSESRSLYAAWTPQLIMMFASFSGMFWNSRSRSPVLWDFPGHSDVCKGGGGCSSRNVSMRLCIDCWGNESAMSWVFLSDEMWEACGPWYWI